MATRPSRYRSSTSASNPPATTKAAEVLQRIFHVTRAVIATPTRPSGYPDIQALVRYARQTHQHLAALRPPSPAQDDFRRLHGFQLLLSVLRAFAGFYNPQVRSEPERQDLFELLHATLAVLSAALRGHHGNRRYFRHRVEGGGWEAFEQTLASIGLGVSDLDLWSNCQFFGKLLSFALDDQRMDELCQWVATAAGEAPSKKEDGESVCGGGDGEDGEDGDSIPNKDTRPGSIQKPPAPTPIDLSQMPSKIAAAIGPKTELPNAEVMRAVIGFWESLSRRPDAAADPVSLLVLDTVDALLRVSLGNLSALHSTGILSRFLRLYFSSPSPLSPDERERVLPICRSLMYLGVNQLADAQFLLSSADPAASNFVLEMVAKYAGPPFVQFDLSHCGHSAIELPNLGRTFPPMSGNGYTFTCWLRIDAFDPSTHTTIFGVFDASQTCFLLLYLERDTRNFILQTSITSARPSVRFRSTVFEEDRWYHVALVHRRAKARASLFVDGEFVEQVKAAYPLPPPMIPSGIPDSFVSFATASRSKPTPVQASLGTPRDLATHIGQGRVFSKWSLASAHLFEDTLSDDFLAVHYQLGPRYQANYQDSLGGFQTYMASARLALLNDFHSSKDDNSDILRAVRDRASAIVPEQKLLMSILPRSTFRTDGTFLDSLLFRSLSHASAANLLTLTAKSGTAVAINGALPCINDALVRSHGAWSLTGEPILVTPFYFDDNLWRLAGFTALALKLVERTGTADEMVRALEMVFLCINSSWRNSDAMERDNGYAILSMLLRAKLGFSSSSSQSSSSASVSEGPAWKAIPVTGDRNGLSLRVLRLVLAFVGYDHASPLESLLINPLAYRILLVDFDTWRKAPVDTQRLYYEQFGTFAVMSKFHQFNSRRLLRMRIIKRLLDAMKVETISEEILPHFLLSFESLVRCNYNAEVHRSLALFITYSLHAPAASSLHRAPRPLSAKSKSSTTATNALLQRTTTGLSSSSGSSSSNNTVEPGPSAAPSDTARLLTKKELGVKILKLYEQLLCEKGTVAGIRKFARTVTNKWLLFLLSSDDPDVLVSGGRILTRLLVTQGAVYTSKFGSKSGGFWILANRLKHWWDVPAVWLCILSILFAKDVVASDVQSQILTYDMLVSVFGLDAKAVYADALYAVVAMLQQGLADVLKSGDGDGPGPGSPADGAAAEPQSTATAAAKSPGNAASLEAVARFFSAMHASSAEFRDFALMSDYVRLIAAALFPSIVSMEALPPETELNAKDAPLRFEGADVVVRQRATSSVMVRTSSINSSLSSSLYSNLGASTTSDAAASDSTLFASTDSVHSITGRPGPAPLVAETRHRRSSSFILLTAQATPPSWHTARLTAHATPKRQLVVVAQPAPNAVQSGLLRLITDVFVDQVLVRKEFPGFGLGLKIPPSFQEHQTYFESYLLRNTILRLEAMLRRNLQVLCEPKVLTNMARFTAHLVESTFEGHFVNGVDVLLDFAGMVLEYLHRPDVSSVKSVRLCSQAVMAIRVSFLKLVLFRLADIDAEAEGTNDAHGHAGHAAGPEAGPGAGHKADAPSPDALPVLERIFFWQSTVIDCLSADSATDDYYMKLIFYQLYARLLDPDEAVRLAAASIWRVLLVQKPNQSAAVLRQCATTDQLHLARSFRRLTEVDDGAFLEWVDKHRPSLDAFFLGGMSKFWDEFVTGENQRAAEAAKTRLARRRDKLKQWAFEAADRGNVLLRHELANSAWMKSIFATEHFKLQRLMQDQQDDHTFQATMLNKMERDLRRPGAVFAEAGTPAKWKLDRTEGRNRMRLRLLPDASSRGKEAFLSRKKVIESAASSLAPSGATASRRGLSSSSASSLTTPTLSSTSTATLSVATRKVQVTIPSQALADAELPTEASINHQLSAGADDGSVPTLAETEAAGVAPEEEFELIDDPNEPDADDGFEDKNRKVMRRLEQGDVVQNVYNVSRIIGLDACEGILIVGKDCLYLMDNVFQCRDGEIVNAWQAPADERDPFSQIITTKPSSGGGGGSGSHDKDANGNGGATGPGLPSAANGTEQESRSWRWYAVISVSKRRFLFRDVAIEIFFRDGRSYLLTTLDNAKRDELYGRLVVKIPHATGPASALPHPEDAWRLEALRVVDEGPQTLGSKFGSIFNASPWNPSMRRWQKGELSNFHYLMLVNTMAGRTFNDLTQYPVFPWVLADYTSDELDLGNPATFRDLSKPMGAQTAQRQADFAMRYSSMAEMGQPPFHYGTHYSSAMVVSSYLIRLPPFVQSFLLLQGGHFDHPDRLFYSVEAAWRSASRDNGADVRELIPEFFCLPEFLVNINGYDFGRRQDGSPVDNVVLPPWAKGDPSIFVAKHREALESPFVSQHLHQWIDLVFGHKQRGDAAVESLNVFHHLSYDGATDLDNIADPQERAIVTGIIHNFGQTPRQVFSRPHPARDGDGSAAAAVGRRRLDTAAAALARRPHLILESRERVASLLYVPKLDRLLCASPFRLNLPPLCDKYLEWGYADNSIRFFHSDNRKLAGLFENLHIGQISCVAFGDSQTLITAGEDCAVTVYTVLQQHNQQQQQQAGSGGSGGGGGGGGGGSSSGSSGKAVDLLTRSSLFGHKTPVTTVAVSNAFSLLLTVSQDGVAMLWDLNRLEFIRKLPGARSVECARINDVTGEIMLCSGPSVVLYSLNGELLLDQKVCGDGGDAGDAGDGDDGGDGPDRAADSSPNNNSGAAADDYVHACAFYEGAGNEWLANALVLTGHRRGRVNIWRKTVGTRTGRWQLELVRRLDHVDPKSETGANVDAAITCITPMPQLVYTGDEDGRVSEWTLIQKDR